MNEELARVQMQENRALRQFIYYLGFDPYTVIAELLDPNEIAQKSAALSALKVSANWTDSPLSASEKKFAEQWVKKISRSNT